MAPGLRRSAAMALAERRNLFRRSHPLDMLDSFDQPGAERSGAAAMSEGVSVEELIGQAKSAASKAYAPYSKFAVGAALCGEGKVYTGCNVENASYGLTICAERNAVAAAIAAGALRIDAIAVYTDTDRPTPPCGACRQVLAEFGPAMAVYLACRDDKTVMFGLDELLPHRFDEGNL